MIVKLSCDTEIEQLPTVLDLLLDSGFGIVGLDTERTGRTQRDARRRFALEQAVIALLAHYGKTANTRSDAPGVYINGDKIATILKAAKYNIEPYWPGLFADALKDVKIVAGI